MSFEKDMLRKTAGLPFSTKKQSLFEGKISKIRTMDVETELLRIFSGCIRDVKRLRELIEGNNNNKNYYNGPIGYDSYRLKDESGDIDKERLFSLSLEKLDLIEESLSECFGIKKEENKEPEEDDEEEDDEEEEW